MRFYRQYPMLTPFVGERFHVRRQPAVLLVGESHYLPASSSIHLDEVAWYAGSGERLSSKETAWINTAQIVRSACAGGFKSKAFSIWRNSFKTINEHGPRYSNFVEVAEDVAFYNFFLRPAREGRSLRAGPTDIELANEAFDHWCRELRPTLVVFLSALARRSLRPDNVKVTTAVVPHPTSQWWYRRSKAYGGRAGHEALAGYVSGLAWQREDASR